MDFTDSADEAAFRAEARAWLEANRPTAADFADLDPVAAAKMWQRRKFDAGWACISWPREYGGRGGSEMQEVIFNQEEAKVLPYELKVFTVGHGMAGPTLMSWATEEDKRRLVPLIASGEQIWCQLFSEPAAGSDLAALRMKAVRDGDDWVVNGQKTWTSNAHQADWGILVVRTDPTVPKHRGLTYFFVDMKSPGIECKLIRQIVGDSDFNDVFFSDVRIPDSQRLGAVGEGWKVSLTTLMHERGASLRRGGRPSVLAKVRNGFFEPLRALAETVTIGDRPAIEDAQVRARLASCYVLESGLRYTSYRTLSALSRGQSPGSESSIGKLLSAANGQEMASLAIDLMEQEGVIHDGPRQSRARLPVSGHISFGSKRPDRRRHGRDSQEHHRRQGAGAATGRPCGQIHSLQRSSFGTCPLLSATCSAAPAGMSFSERPKGPMERGPWASGQAVCGDQASGMPA
jgi:acyl-CoA dehydrogenase